METFRFKWMDQTYEIEADPENDDIPLLAKLPNPEEPHKPIHVLLQFGKSCGQPYTVRAILQTPGPREATLVTADKPAGDEHKEETPIGPQGATGDISTEDDDKRDDFDDE